MKKKTWAAFALSAIIALDPRRGGSFGFIEIAAG